MDDGLRRSSSGRLREVAIDTLLAGAGLTPAGPAPAEPSTACAGPRPLAQPLHAASVHVFEDLAQVDEVWEGRLQGHIYRRFGHPNGEALERVLALLEGADSSVACTSGMAALYVALLAGPEGLRPGDCLVAQQGLYGGTQTLLVEELSRLGIRSVFAASPTPRAFEETLSTLPDRSARVMLLVETIANPSLVVADIPGLASLAESRGIRLVVDNTFATPLACRPLEQGADIVIHSATKYLNGHSDVIGGLAAGRESWATEARKTAIAIGVTMPPFDAWLTLRGLRTLHLRFQRHMDNAGAVADWLGGQAGVEKVLYPGLPDHPSHATAARVLSGFGGMVSFEIRGGETAVTDFLRRLRHIRFSPSLGETVTTVTYPARTSHRSLEVAEKEAAGATPGLVRLSVGTEDIHDIVADLEQALPA